MINARICSPNLVFATSIALSASNPAFSADLNLKIQTSWSDYGGSLEYLNENWVPKLPKMTNNALSVKLMPIGSVVPRQETAVAISRGLIDGDWTSISNFSGKDPAFALMGNFFAGYQSPDQILDLCKNGGGKEMLQKLHDVYHEGVQVVGCGSYDHELYFSNVPIQEVTDLNGLRFFFQNRLASDVFKRVGASPVSIPTSEVYAALESGMINAIDNSSIEDFEVNGLPESVRYSLSHALHSIPSIQLTISKKIWNELSEENRNALIKWHEMAIVDLREVTGNKTIPVTPGNLPKSANIVFETIDWSESELSKIKNIASKSWTEFAEASDLARETYEVHAMYRKSIGLN